MTYISTLSCNFNCVNNVPVSKSQFVGRTIAAYDRFSIRRIGCAVVDADGWKI